MKKIILAASCVAFLAGPAFAQTAAPVTTAKPPVTAPVAQPKPPKAAPGLDKPARTAKSLECSKQADTQNLHGKPRKKFMSTCKKA